MSDQVQDSMTSRLLTQKWTTSGQLELLDFGSASECSGLVFGIRLGLRDETWVDILRGAPLVWSGLESGLVWLIARSRNWPSYRQTHLDTIPATPTRINYYNDSCTKMHPDNNSLAPTPSLAPPANLAIEMPDNSAKAAFCTPSPIASTNTRRDIVLRTLPPLLLPSQPLYPPQRFHIHPTLVPATQKLHIFRCETEVARDPLARMQFPDTADENDDIEDNLEADEAEAEDAQPGISMLRS